MKVLSTTGLVLMLSLMANLVTAENPPTTRGESAEAMSRDLWEQELKATPEMWFYLQERMRNEDPQSILRRKAEIKASQRRQRIATKKRWASPAHGPTRITRSSADTSHAPIRTRGIATRVFGSRRNRRSGNGRSTDNRGWSSRSIRTIRAHGRVASFLYLSVSRLR